MLSARHSFFIIIALLAAEQSSVGQISSGRDRKFDTNWLFTRGDPAGAEKPDFADSAWRALDVPHDWSIEGPIDRGNATGARGGFLPSGLGWYRKHFTLNAADVSKRVLIRFDGVMANSDVYVNGFHLGHRPNGWVTFQYDLSGHVTFGADRPNVLAVRVDESKQPASRFYEGAGIYRHVWLSVVDPLHVANGGVYVTTPSVTAEQATVKIATTIENRSVADRAVTVRVRVAPAESTASKAVEVAAAPATATVPAGKSAELASSCIVRNPRLWDIDHPHLYSAVIEVVADGRVHDSQTVRFGIRDAVFRADSGFRLNGRNVKLLGVCLHSEGGAFGTAVPDRVWEQRLGMLKALGVNAVRTAHNPPSPDFLDICDRMGLLVMDELFDVWTVGKYNDKDYHLYFHDWWRQDVTDTVLRDRNHPSIVIYSAGNEIHDNLASLQGRRQFTEIRDVFHQYDPARPVTMGILQPVQHNIFTSGFSDLMDVVGVNYRDAELLAAHRDKPDYKILGTENGHGRPAWLALRDNPAHAGQFLWTGIDYLGESAAWPNIGADFGLLDRTGSVKPRGFQRASWWSQKPMIYIVRGVNGAGQNARGCGDRDGGNVEVYSNCQSVELFLNGQSLGAKTKPADDSSRVWTTADRAGKLKAIGSNDGKPVAVTEFAPAGAAVKLRVGAESRLLPHDFDDVAAVRVTVSDAEGNTVTSGNPLIEFKIAGPGEIAAIDNAARDNHEGFRGSQIHAAAGECCAWVRSTADAGDINVTISSPGLSGATVSFTSQPPATASRR